jgi:aminoglycoside phosphotransferase (APT) family kinase protein
MSKENSTDISTNQIQILPEGVIKRYHGPGALHRWQTEISALTGLKGFLPVPAILECKQDLEVRMAHISGKRAAEMLAEGILPGVLSSAGKLLAKIQQFPVQELHGTLTGNGRVLSHGDFSLFNILLEPNTKQITAMLDWEWSHLGDPVEDAAWMEWTVRLSYGKYAKELPAFYEAYGEIPDWQSRKEVMIMQCQRYLEFARMLGERKNIQQWQNRLQITKRMQPF